MWNLYIHFLCISVFTIIFVEASGEQAEYHFDLQQTPFRETADFELSSVEVELYGSPAVQHSGWNYHATTGPILWATLGTPKDFGKCSIGRRQSPINIDPTGRPSTEEYGWSAKPPTTFNMENVVGAHTIKLNPQSSARRLHEVIMNGKDQFLLHDIHFHTPSEHRFGDEYFPIEAHFVLRSVNRMGANPRYKFVVRGIFFNVFDSSEKDVSESDFWKNISPHLDKVKKPGQHTEIINVNTANIMKIFREDGGNRHVWRYEGSLTTPPCTDVTFDILSRPQLVSVATYNKLKDILKFNARYTNNLPSRQNLLVLACSDLSFPHGAWAQ